MTQYIAVKFAPEDKRTYTYRNEGESVKVGDLVEINTRYAQKRCVMVEAIDLERPNFVCKAILGLAPPAEMPSILAETDDHIDIVMETKWVDKDGNPIEEAEDDPS